MHNENIRNYQEFCSILENYKVRLQNGNAEFTNKSTEHFLEAMQAWLIDTEGGYNFDKSHPGYISWNDIYQLIISASAYE